MTAPPIWIVASTGRCGSTLLSEVLEHHPDVLSLSEFLRPLVMSGLGDAAQPIDAASFARLLRQSLPSASALLRAGVELAELRYPFDRPGARYGRTDDVPFPLTTALSRLAPDPDSALDELTDRILERQGVCVGDHLEQVFATLHDMFGGMVLVERSGGSLGFLPELRRLVPRARLLLMTRDGPATALSMSRHPYFRHIALRSLFHGLLGYDPFTSSRRDGIETLPAMLRDVLPENFGRANFEALDLPADLFGALWSRTIMRGLPALPDGAPILSYEGLGAAPLPTLAALAEWLGVSAPDGWLATAADLIRPPAATDRQDSAPFESACAPGIAALKARGVH